jgi:hypothetical protein
MIPVAGSHKEQIEAHHMTKSPSTPLMSRDRDRDRDREETGRDSSKGERKIINKTSSRDHAVLDINGSVCMANH